jgi:hypothetical protein
MLLVVEILPVSLELLRTEKAEKYRMNKTPIVWVMVQQHNLIKI